MKIYLYQQLAAALLFLSPFAVIADPAFEGDVPPPYNEAYRRPTERWLEKMLKNDPDEYRRLHQLRETDPDAFAGELRTRIQTRSIERLRNSHQNISHPPFKFRPKESDNRRKAGDSSEPMTRKELETAYDLRTSVIEKEVEKISRQLENLRRMLEERKKKRDRVITRHQTSDR